MLHFSSVIILTTIYTKFVYFSANLMPIFVKVIGTGTAPSNGANWEKFSEQN